MGKKSSARSAGVTSVATSSGAKAGGAKPGKAKDVAASNSSAKTVRQKAASTSDTNSVQIKLGTEEFLKPLFDYYELSLLEGMEHAFSMTLLRDQFYAGWAHVWKDKVDKVYHLKISTPTPADNVQGYADVIPRYLQAVDIARKAFDKAAAIETNKPIIAEANLRFLPPFGLSMLKAHSVLLLHYPPDETLDYKDYLHSRTTKRWESLLMSNGCPGPNHPLFESIVDVYPVTADGGSGGSTAVDNLCKSSEEIKSELAEYANQMLSLLLQQDDFPRANVTQPLLAMGAKVRDWFFYNKHLKAQMVAQLGPLTKPSQLTTHTVFYLEFKEGVRTPVIILDHPSNYYRGAPADRVEQVRKDLIGAKWQIDMAKNPTLDPKEVLANANVYWNSPRNKAIFDRVVQDQETEFKNIHKDDEC